MCVSSRLLVLLCASVFLGPRFGMGQTGPAPSENRTVTVDAGVPLHVVLDKRVSYTKTGRELHGHISQPVYVFDQIVVPAGTGVVGKIAEVHSVSKMKRFDALISGDFTPLRDAQVEFDALVLNGGKQIPIQSAGAMRDSAVVQMGGSAAQRSLWQRAKDSVRNTITTQKRSFEDMVRKPNKMERLKNGVLARLPIHPQVFEAGTQFVAELEAPIQVQLPPGPPSPPTNLDEVGMRPPVDSILHARLNSALSSATNKWGDPVEAILTEPVFSAEHHLILPEGTLLLGAVLQAKAAQRFGQSGELRFSFKEIQLPSGVRSKMRGELAAADGDKAANIKIDEEGGAHASSPKAKYLVPLAIVLLAQTTGESDRDGINGGGGGSVNNGIAGGGFGLMGRLLALSSGSRFIAYGIGYYGAARSIYSRFIAHGRDVVFPRGTQIEIKVGTR
jgi:hypothetical protein